MQGSAHVQFSGFNNNNKSDTSGSSASEKTKLKVGFGGVTVASPSISVHSSAGSSSPSISGYSSASAPSVHASFAGSSSNPSSPSVQHKGSKVSIPGASVSVHATVASILSLYLSLLLFLIISSTTHCSPNISFCSAQGPQGVCLCLNKN